VEGGPKATDRVAPPLGVPGAPTGVARGVPAVAAGPPDASVTGRRRAGGGAVTERCAGCPIDGGRAR